jgi:hypothetical protein
LDCFLFKRGFAVHQRRDGRKHWLGLQFVVTNLALGDLCLEIGNHDGT